MKHYIVIDENDQHISHGHCADEDFALQAGVVSKDSQGHPTWEAIPGLRVIEGRFNQLTQKIRNGKVVDKTSIEIEASKAPEIPIEDQRASITNKQLAQILARLDALEGR